MKKSVLIDLYKANNPFSGLGQFSLNIARTIHEMIVGDLDINFLIPKNFPSELITQNQYIQASLLRRIFPYANRGFDVWHCLQQFPSFLPPKNTKLILTIHDLNFLYEKTGRKQQKYLNRLQNNIKRANVITTISNFTKQEIQKHTNTYGKAIEVIYNGVEAPSEILAKKPAFINFTNKFFFSIGIFNKKKNFEVLIPLMSHFADYKLIIAGNSNTAYFHEVKELIERNNLTDRVLLPGSVSNNERSWLYLNCEAFLFPSLAEGFGMPAIEAMKAGKPVFLSKYTSLPEIGGNVAYYFSDFNAENMAGCIVANLKNFRANMAENIQKMKEYSKRFDWEAAVTAYISVYKNL